jgi:L-ascorbate metabolism protein UlaG (beta-lactamase superfamily)
MKATVESSSGNAGVSTSALCHFAGPISWMMSMHAKRIAFALLMVALVASGLAQTPTPGQKKDIKITWLGHSAFEIVSPNGTDIMIDPFLTKNPATPTELKDLAHYHPGYVLVTHSHGDHLGDAIDLAKMSKAKLVCVAMPEAFKRGELPKELFEGVNVGDLVKAGDVKIHVVPAMHSSEPSGRPVGFVIEFADGRSVYHEGDTWIFGDMALIQEFYHPNIILMPVGAVADDQMPQMAWLAVTRYFNPEVVIPMHYGALPGSSKEEDPHKIFGKDPRVVFMKPGETKSF